MTIAKRSAYPTANYRNPASELVPIIVDLGHLTTECMIRWERPEMAVKAITSRLCTILDHVREHIGRPKYISVHAARPLPWPAMSTMIADGELTGVDVLPELDRHRAAEKVFVGLRELRLSVPVGIHLGISRYRGIGVHPARGERLRYTEAEGGKRREPVVSQGMVDMQIGRELVEAALLTPLPAPLHFPARRVALLTVDVDLTPMVELLVHHRAECHLLHYAAASLPRSLRDAATSATALPGVRKSIATLAGASRPSLLDSIR